jgi:hypothetical protein
MSIVAFPQTGAGSSSAIIAALPKPEVYFDAPGNVYYVLNDRQMWMPFTETALKRKLTLLGLSARVDEGELLSEIDTLLYTIQTTKDVDYVGPLAGHKAGLCTIQATRALVTTSPVFIEPEQGDWLTIKTLLINLLGMHQLGFLLSWLKVAITALRKGERREGQVLVIAGCAGAGKSVLQNLITRLLGGRSAKPYQFMTDKTQFNSDLFHAEHLMIEDEAASFKLLERRALGASLKAFVANEFQRCHPKNRVAVTLMPLWRVSITLNDEAESLMVLPPMDENLLDKIILLRAAKMPMPMPTDTLDQLNAFKAVLTAELPRFIYAILNEWQIPEELRCGRYGVIHYHNPELMQMMDALAPETKLLELIDAEIFGTGKGQSLLPDSREGWEGKASDLEAKLSGESSGVKFESRKLLVYTNACGSLLGRLKLVHTARISSRVSRGATIWEILPPVLLAVDV